MMVVNISHSVIAKEPRIVWDSSYYRVVNKYLNIAEYATKMFDKETRAS